MTIATIPKRRRPKKTADPYVSKTIGRAFDVLDCFTSERPNMSLTEIGACLEMPESSLFRVLTTLESRGCLHQNEDGSFELTPNILFGKLHERSQRIRKIARPCLEGLVGRFDETASLAYLFEDRIQVLDTIESLHVIKFINRVGRVIPPHASSMGKAISAFQTPGRIDRILEAYGLIRRTEHTIVDRQRLTEELEHVRKSGYAFDREESVLGGVCIGAPIAMDGYPVLAAFSVSTPIARLSAKREKEITAAVVAAGRATAAAIHRNSVPQNK